MKNVILATDAEVARVKNAVLAVGAFDRGAVEVTPGAVCKLMADLADSERAVFKLQAELAKLQAEKADNSRLHPEWKGRNEYGLDMHYFRLKLEQILRDLNRFTPEEFARTMATHSRTADSGVIAREFTAPVPTPATVPDKWFQFVRCIATDYDHDSDAHRYGTPCRVCDAEVLLQSAPVPIPPTDNTDLLQIAEEVAGKVQHTIPGNWGRM